MSCVGLDHINIECLARDYNSVIEFYCSVLGLTVGKRPEMSHHGAWLYAGDRAVIHVSIRDQVRAPGGTINHFAFSCTELGMMLENLTAHGLAFQKKVLDDGQVTQVFLCDPLANRVELNFRI